VTLAFARRSREQDGGTDDALAAGVLLAWAITNVRVAFLAGFVHLPLVSPLLVPLGVMTAVILAAVVLLLHRTRREEPTPAGPVALRNPFSLTSAIEFGLLFAAVLLFVAFVRHYFPAPGYYVVAALAGMPDVDAITLSLAGLARDGGVGARTATAAVVVAVLSNTLVKCGIIVALGGSRLRVRILAASALAVAAALLALAWR
jgi:uncharacterized membrane protein (DUF4010 family)